MCSSITTVDDFYDVATCFEIDVVVRAITKHSWFECPNVVDLATVIFYLFIVLNPNVIDVVLFPCNLKSFANNIIFSLIFVCSAKDSLLYCVPTKPHCVFESDNSISKMFANSLQSIVLSDTELLFQSSMSTVSCFNGRQFASLILCISVIVSCIAYRHCSASSSFWHGGVLAILMIKDVNILIIHLLCLFVKYNCGLNRLYLVASRLSAIQVSMSAHSSSSSSASVLMLPVCIID